MTRTSSVAIAIACALVFSATGCGRSAGPSADHHDPEATAGAAAATPEIAQHELTDAGLIARDYALAARRWTPATYQAQYRRQLELSTGSLHRALERLPPTSSQIAQYRGDGASLRADVESVTVRRQSATEAQFAVVLSEVSTAAGQTTTQRTVNLVALQQRGERWRVSGFTITP